MRRYATMDDFKKDIDILMKVWSIYKGLYNEKLIENSGAVSVDEMNELIIEAKKQAGAKLEHEISIEGFFDIYVAQLFTINNSEVVNEILDEQLRKIKSL